MERSISNRASIRWTASSAVGEMAPDVLPRALRRALLGAISQPDLLNELHPLLCRPGKACYKYTLYPVTTNDDR